MTCDFESMIDQDGVSSSYETLYSMMEQERTTYSSCDYFQGDSDNGRCSEDSSCADGSNCSSSAIIHIEEFLNIEKVTPADRMALIDWCYAIVDQGLFKREIVAIAMNIVDRFMSTPHTSTSSTRSHEVDALHDRTEYQLITVTALYLSIKLNEQTFFGIQDFTAGTRGAYSFEDIEGMELKILHALSWRVCPPTSLQVGNHILSLLLPRETIAKLEPGTLDFLHEEVAFQTENAIREYSFVTQRPSTIAAAAIINAIEKVSNQDCEYLTETLECILSEFPFESTAVLLEVRYRLLCLMSENKDAGNGTGIVFERIRVPPYEEELLISSAEEEPSIASTEEEHSLQVITMFI